MSFVDTSFWIALRVPRDGHHAAAQRLWSRRTGSLVTSNLIVGETWTFIRRRAGHREAQAFVDAVSRSPRLTIMRVDQETELDAWAWLRRLDERVYSFVDATSFAKMRRLGVLESLVFDGDFTAAGFVEIRP